jgi:TetR/AcrR family transcriptional regulator, transcriptional repressor of aconitase
MPKIVDVARKRGEIVAAATATFARHGYRGTNLARVAAAAGMGKSSLYHYFPTREALFNAIASDILHHEAALFESLVDRGGPATERLRLLLDAITAMFDGWAEAGPLLIDFLREPRGRRRLRDTLRVARGAIARLIRDGQREGAFRRGSPDALATVVLGCLDGLFLQDLVEPGCTRQNAARDVLPALIAAALRHEGGR